MCNRIHLTIAEGGATYQGQIVRAISVDNRVSLVRSIAGKPESLPGHPPQPEDSTHPYFGRAIVTLTNSDKPGIVILADCLGAPEFTDSIPEGVLAVEYVEPTTSSEAAPQ